MIRLASRSDDGQLLVDFVAAVCADDLKACTRAYRRVNRRGDDSELWTLTSEALSRAVSRMPGGVDPEQLATMVSTHFHPIPFARGYIKHALLRATGNPATPEQSRVEGEHALLTLSYLCRTGQARLDLQAGSVQ